MTTAHKGVWRRMEMVVVLALFAATSLPAQELLLTVTNPETFERSGEVLEVPWSDLEGQHPGLTSTALRVLLLPERVELPHQRTREALLVRIDLGPGQSRDLLVQAGIAPSGQHESLVDGRFVLPREDYAWENDRIAFRVYGSPKAGQVRNGLDVWTKRVRRLIVAKWYRKSEGSPPGGDSYHVDRGEGADFFHVSESLGAGAAGLWAGGSLHQPGMFATWETLENGPLRVQFELTYDSIRVDSLVYSETCRMTLDAGSNLNRIDVVYRGPRTPEELTIACGLVKRAGTIAQANPSEGWLSLWGPTTADTVTGSLGTGVVFLPEVTPTVAEDSVHHFFLGTATVGMPFTYYAGAGWTRSGDFDSREDWQGYLSRTARVLHSPLRVTTAELGQK